MSSPQQKSILLGSISIGVALLSALLAVITSPVAGLITCVVALCLAIASLTISRGRSIIGIVAVILSVVCGAWSLWSGIDLTANSNAEQTTSTTPPDAEQSFRIGWDEDEAAPVGTEVDLGSLRATVNSVTVDESPADVTISPDEVLVTVNVTTDTTEHQERMYTRGTPMLAFSYYSPSGDKYPEQLAARDHDSHRSKAFTSNTSTTTGNVSFVVPRATADQGIMTVAIAGTGYLAFLALN